MSDFNGIYVRLAYVGPRKRKSQPWGCAAETLDECLDKVKAWRKDNGGKFLEGGYTAAKLHDSTIPDGRVIRMQTVCYPSPYQKLIEDQINWLNQ